MLMILPPPCAAATLQPGRQLRMAIRTNGGVDAPSTAISAAVTPRRRLPPTHRVRRLRIAAASIGLAATTTAEVAAATRPRATQRRKRRQAPIPAGADAPSAVTMTRAPRLRRQ